MDQDRRETKQVNTVGQDVTFPDTKSHNPLVYGDRSETKQAKHLLLGQDVTFPDIIFPYTVLDQKSFPGVQSRPNLAVGLRPKQGA